MFRIKLLEDLDRLIESLIEVFKEGFKVYNRRDFLFKENVKCKVSKKILSGKHDGCL